ncbi:MAG: hypothetical protein ACK5PS_17155 [Desulfopila sp.]
MVFLYLVFIRKLPTRSRWHFLGIFMVGCGCGTWSSHAGLSENRQHGKRCYRAKEFHGWLWPRLPGPAMLVYLKIVSTENAVTAPSSFMVGCGWGDPNSAVAMPLPWLGQSW